MFSDLKIYSKTNIHAVRTSGDNSVGSLLPSSSTLTFLFFGNTVEGAYKLLTRCPHSMNVCFSIENIKHFEFPAAY